MDHKTLKIATPEERGNFYITCSIITVIGCIFGHKLNNILFSSSFVACLFIICNIIIMISYLDVGLFIAMFICSYISIVRLVSFIVFITYYENCNIFLLFLEISSTVTCVILLKEICFIIRHYNIIVDELDKLRNKRSRIV